MTTATANKPLSGAAAKKAREDARKAEIARRNAEARAANPAEHFHPGGCYECHSFFGPILNCTCKGCNDMRGHHPERTLQYGRLALAGAPAPTEAAPALRFGGTDKQRGFVRSIIERAQLSEKATASSLVRHGLVFRRRHVSRVFYAATRDGHAYARRLLEAAA